MWFVVQAVVARLCSCNGDSVEWLNPVDDGGGGLNYGGSLKAIVGMMVRVNGGAGPVLSCCDGGWRSRS